LFQILNRYSDIILSYRVKKFEQFGDLFRLGAEVDFLDHSRLIIRETIIGRFKRKYAYHWQDKGNKLIIRWDNAPDWDVDTFPHHKHIAGKENVEPSYERTLEQVLDVIKRSVHTNLPTNNMNGRE